MKTDSFKISSIYVLSYVRDTTIRIHASQQMKLHFHTFKLYNLESRWEGKKSWTDPETQIKTNYSLNIKGWMSSLIINPSKP